MDQTPVTALQSTPPPTAAYELSPVLDAPARVAAARPASPQAASPLALPLAFIVAYLVLTAWGMSLAETGGVTSFFPAFGLALGAIVIGGRRWVGFAALATVLAAPLTYGVDEPLLVLATAAAIAIALGGAGLILRGRLDPVRPLTRVSDVWWLIGVGILGGPTVAAALVSGAALVLNGATLGFDTSWTLALAGALGVAALTPVLLVWSAAYRRFGAAGAAPDRAMLRPEGLAAMALVLGLTPVVYLASDGEFVAIATLPLCWLALRFALPGAVIGTAAWICSGALAVTLAGGSQTFGELQSFLLAGAMITLIVGTVVAERNRTQRSLRHLAMYDQASGLPNEPHLLERLDHTLTDPRGLEVSLLLVRFAGLRQVAAAMRREDTDRLVELLTEQLGAIAGPKAEIARPGFDRFTVLITGSTAHRRQQIAEKLIDELSAPLPVDSREVFVDPRVGITVGLPGEPADVVLAHADYAADVAAVADGERIGYYDASIERAQRDRQELTEDLRLAVERNEFLLAFQPIVTAKDGRVVSAEALLRWVDRKRGNVPPDQFVPIAEDTGLILPIGRWVLNEACRRAASWPHVGGEAIGVSVNVSPIQLLDEGFLKDVASALERSGLPAERLRVEITEGIVVRDIDRTVQMIQALRDIGVETMLDDFGTGHSSLAWVQRLPVTCIKIDRAFISDIAVDGIDRAIVHASLYLSRALGTDTVAEGVETEAQRDQLVRMGCQKLQGYLFARPQPADVFPDWLNRQRRAIEAEESQPIDSGLAAVPNDPGDSRYVA